MKLITIEEDKTFLLLQIEERKGYMSSVDSDLYKQENLVSLSFFSNDVDNQTKEKMLIAIKKPAKKKKVKRLKGKGLMDSRPSCGLKN